MATMLFLRIAETSKALSATRSRKAKTALLARLLSEAGDSASAVVNYLSGQLPHGKIGVGWAAVRALDLPPPRAEPSVDLARVNEAFSEVAATSGPGSQAKRRDLLTDLFSQFTEPERQFFESLFGGGLRQGSLDGLMVEGIASAYDLDADVVRRGAMLTGDLAATVEIARVEGLSGLRAISMQLFRPLLPMLAQSAETVEIALDGLEHPTIEYKVDGARIQVHKRGDRVAIYTRNLHDATDRMPEIVSVVQSFEAHSLVLDGEAISLDHTQRPLPFQTTMERFGAQSSESPGHVHPFFFDVLHIDGTDLLDESLATRQQAMSAAVPAECIVTTSEVAPAESLADAVAHGYEGVMVKDLSSPYQAGRRGSAWIKVKPVHTLDLVVLAVEWGSGRRKGWLSNIHLGARDGEAFVMLGKTFKGMTDEMLEWQTARFLELETHREGHVVHLRPEQVVEIAVDGVLASPRYPAGMALRFARVKQYRDDKSPHEADTVETVRALFESSRP